MGNDVANVSIATPVPSTTNDVQTFHAHKKTLGQLK